MNKDKHITVPALFDTGATRTSIDESIAEYLKLGPVIGKSKVKSKTFGIVERDIVKCEIEVKGIKFVKNVSISKRKDMFTKALIGRDVIHGNFIVDVSLTHNSESIEDIKNKK